MKRLVVCVVAVLLTANMAFGQTSSDSSAMVEINQAMAANGPALSGSPVSAETNTDVKTGDVVTTANPSATSILSLRMEASKIPDYKTPPTLPYPGYLPTFQPNGPQFYENGPSKVDGVYDLEFDSKKIGIARKVLVSMKHNGPVEMVWGMFVQLMPGGTDYSHRGRGIQTVNSLWKDRRPAGKPLIVLVDSGTGAEADTLRDHGYIYVGHIGAIGKTRRDWDQALSSAVCESWLWDVDYLVVSGGNKVVMTGITGTSGVGAATSQTNISLAQFFGKTGGETESKSKPVVTAMGFRLDINARNQQKSLMEKGVPKIIADTRNNRIAEAKLRDAVAEERSFKRELTRALLIENEKQALKAQLQREEDQRIQKIQQIDSKPPVK